VSGASGAGRAAPSPLAATLFVASGACALLYQVLWQRHLALLFGSGAVATAVTLAAFFLGLAAGSLVLGRVVARAARPLRAFGWMEAGAALGALLVAATAVAWRALNAQWGALAEATPEARLAAKAAFALLALFPASFLMGGTLPALAEHAVRGGRALAPVGTALYALNTLGAAAGALAAGFVLPQALGYRGAALAASGLGLVVGLVALAAGGRGAGPAPLPPAEPPPGPPRPRRLSRQGFALAAWSGFAALALEVLWTRTYAEALQNSSYTFSLLLAIYLLALAAGALLAHALARRVRSPAAWTRGLAVAAGLAAAASPTLIAALVPSPDAVGGGRGFAAYLWDAALRVGGMVLPVGLAVGTVFPFLLAREAGEGGGPAAPVVGRLLATNTAAAIAGALAAGFVLPPLVGAWPACVLLGAGYLVFALDLAPRRERRGAQALSNTGILALLVLLGVLALAQDEAARRWRARPGETVLDLEEGPSGTVAVVARGDDLKLKLNSAYTLGGTAEPRWERLQAHLPLSLHPAPRRVFFVGLGTGITAGAALSHPVERVVATEIAPEVVRAARRHFEPWLGGLFEHPAVEVVAEDARTVLEATGERYEVVVGDLFLPWKRGVGLLFTVEHFARVRERLAPGGLFAQWLPLYQLDREEFLAVARAFLAAFPDATLWRGDFFARRPIVALVGRRDAAPLDGDAIAAAWRALEAGGATRHGASAPAIPFLLYAGRLDGARATIETAPLPTDDRPWIEFRAPRSQRARAAREATAFVGEALLAFQRGLLEATPPESDPLLAGLSGPGRDLVRAGLALYAYAVHDAGGDTAARREAFKAFVRHTRAAERPALGDWVR
jgi:spermidine synthase